MSHVTKGVTTYYWEGGGYNTGGGGGANEVLAMHAEERERGGAGSFEVVLTREFEVLTILVGEGGGAVKVNNDRSLSPKGSCCLVAFRGQGA